MSATNWDDCPACAERAAKEKADKLEEAAKAYGKVPAAEWKAMLADAESSAKNDDDAGETLREDYEMGVGLKDRPFVFWVSYHCECQLCGFSHRFKHEEDLSKKKKARTT